jgi:hypothetical protein
MRLLGRILLGVAVVACTSATGAAQDKAGKQPTQNLPGAGVGDPNLKKGVFPNATGGLDAIDLESGKLLWSAKEASHPLLVTANRVYAWAPIAGKGNQVRVAIFDLADGKRLLESQPVVFPDWVSVGVTYGRSFGAAVRQDDGDVYFIWEARAWYAGGARPTPEIEEAARKNASGVFRIDLDTGKSAVVPADKAPAVAKAPIPGEVQNVKVGAMQLRFRDDGVKGNPTQRRRTLEAVNAAGKIVWEREIGAPPVLLPPP